MTTEPRAAPKRRPILFPALFGLVGVTILVTLGVWQSQRLGEKEALIAEIEARMTAPPLDLTTRKSVDPGTDRLLRVRAAGVLGREELHVLTSIKGRGPGFRVITHMTLTDGRRILVDLGYVPERQKNADRTPPNQVEITGLLYWPNETDSFTPAPDRAQNVWFARDVQTMAAALGTEPILVVAQAHPLGTSPLPRPPGVGLPNRHLEYALTWFGLAITWAIMTVVWIVQLRRAAAPV